MITILRKNLLIILWLLASRGLYDLWILSLEVLVNIRQKGLKNGLLNMILRWMTHLVPKKMESIIKDQVKPMVKDVVKAIDDQIEDEGFRFLKLPKKGITKENVLKWTRALQGSTAKKFLSKKALGGFYTDTASEVNEVAVKVYTTFVHTNGLYHALFPAVRKFEAEILSMVNNVLNGPNRHCGIVTHGGTESIFCAVLAYREFYRKTKGITKPNIVVPSTAHVAFSKACHYQGIECRKLKLNGGVPGYASKIVEAVENRIDSNTVMILGSAPCWSGGIIDPIPELAALAKRCNVGMHVDNCLGGLYLSFLDEKERAEIPNFDFTVDGVTSISCDIHKYGGCLKGCSTVLFAKPELRQQVFFGAKWEGGLYTSSSTLGSYSGGSRAQAWAALVMKGESGLAATVRHVHKAFKKVREFIRGHQYLEIWGTPQAVAVAIVSSKLNVRKLVDAMKKRGWGMQVNLSSVQFVIGERQADMIEQYCADLDLACEDVRRNPEDFKECAALYGIADFAPGNNIDTFLGLYQQRLLAPRQ